MAATHKATPRKIGEIVHEAIITAHEKYEKISHGDWLWTAAEYYLTVTIAHQLYKKLGKKYPVAVEYKIRGSDVKDQDSIINKKGRPRKVLPVGSRVDCLLYGKEKQNYKAAAAIEVKTNVCPAGVKVDIERLIGILSGSTHNFPCILAYWAAAGGDRAGTTLEKRIPKMNGIVDGEIQKHNKGKSNKLKHTHKKKFKTVKPFRKGEAGYEDEAAAYLAYCAVIEIVMEQKNGAS